MNPRLMIFLAFAGPALVIAGLGGLAVWALAGAEITPEQMASLHVLYVGGGAAVAVLVLAVAWAVLDQRLAGGLKKLLRDVETATHARTDSETEFPARPELGPLADAVAAMAGALADARHRVDETVAEATGEMEKQAGRLSAILRDLHEGVIVCNLNHEVLLYNHRALELLHLAGGLGLGRPLFTVMNRQPFLHALEQLTERLGTDDPEERAAGLSEPFMATTPDGRHTLLGRMSLILDADGRPDGYVITFEDHTQELAALGRRDHLLGEATEGLRPPVANLRAAAETLEAHPEMSDAERAAFMGVLFSESKILSERLDALTAGCQELITGFWPTTDIYSANLLNAVVRRLRQDGVIEAVMTGLPRWLHGDSYTLVELLYALVDHVHRLTSVGAVDLEATPGGHHVYLDIVWKGDVIPSATLDSWLDGTLAGAWGELTARDVLNHHASEIWSQPHRDGAARLRFPLPPAIEAASRQRRAGLPSRPEFYDLDLFALGRHADEIGRGPLRQLSYVVFDAETTGLEPSHGDEIISLAGVRIINGRILTGESFSALVNPGRPIPKKSQRYHGISDEMVADEPDIARILPEFHAFVGDSVLVAHNAAFDLKFLRLKEAATGVVFDNPVLDTLLLSVFVHDHEERHTLDAIAERFGVEVQGRHTALGDSLVTAAVFLRLIDVLEARGIETLDQAVEAANSIVEVRAQQEQF